METEDPEAWEEHLLIPNEESGSAYEEPDEEVRSSSQEEEEEPQTAQSSRANLATRRGRTKTKNEKARDSSLDQGASEDGSDGEKSRDSSTASQREERQRAASEWAANFQEPESLTDIRTPSRRAARTRSKRKATKPPSEIRAKRLKSWYNDEYRELLNVDIHDAVAGSIVEDQGPLEGSQIGCSIWTANEKDLFFSALSRLGRGSVRDIASRIGTKSEPEVQEYLFLLQQRMLENSSKLLRLTDLPAAIEISDECCGIMERAGDALASRQERTEGAAEQERWGDLWLLDSAANKLLERQRKDEASKNELEETLLAANLFNLRNWLELSRRFFMNPDTEGDNWETVAEAGETPSIRATAIEDFHSLAVSITKRLISTTLFCTMSRQRATGAKTIKHAEVNPDDVDAAVKILGLKMNSQNFWKGCAKRCNLKVFDEECNSFMSYEEVEKALPELKRGRSRSRSMSRCERSVSRAAPSQADQEIPTDSPSLSEDYESHDDSLHGYESDFTHSGSASGSDLIEGEVTSSKSRKERLLKKARAKKEVERAHETYVEAFDQEASRGEERRLWALLMQTAPFDIKPELNDLPDQPKGTFREDVAETSSWRDQVHFRSHWETMDTPVSKESFEKNRKRVSRRAKMRMERARKERDSMTVTSSADDEDVASAAESDVDEHEDFENAQEHLLEGEENPDFGDQNVLEEAAMDSEAEFDEGQHHVEDNSDPENEDQGEGYAYEQVEYENELSVDGSDVVREAFPVPESPMSVDERLSSDEEIRIKAEYESDS